ncbi:Chimeric ERCC6-PGBD3 protein [Eumeta japonica]|uniref:Chimeric ERCC6-PGBD3 protein n=1 Tax=Eumeta variegata TaxID=151549 RepID=A0A4C1YQM3_EUMVA|nr:Chimeric ERCC6-PGBD3 protein [Eumeta japonica]
MEEDDSDGESDLLACREEEIGEKIPLANEEDWNESDDEPLSSFCVQSQSSRNILSRWKHTENFDFTPHEDDRLDISFDPSVIVKSSLEYFGHYIDDGLFEIMAKCTNVCSVSRGGGESLNTTADELRQFFGYSMAMSVLGLPRIRMYWALKTKVYYIANTITRNRFFQLRSNLKVTNDELITQNARQNDKFWKVRPMVSAVEKGCRENKRQLRCYRRANDSFHWKMQTKASC